MRDYQRSKNNRWILPRNLYRQTLYAIRDYNRLREEYQHALSGDAVAIDGQPRGSRISDPTAQTAFKIEKLHDRIRAIERAKTEIPEEYRKGVWDNILYEAPYPQDAAKRTYGEYKSRFVYEVARNLELIY